MTKAQPRGILLASFLTTDSEEQILEEVQYIADNFQLTNKYIFLLRNTEDPNKKVLTYNAVMQKGKFLNQRLFTMRIHRKKSTNTLYKML